MSLLNKSYENIILEKNIEENLDYIGTSCNFIGSRLPLFKVIFDFVTDCDMVKFNVNCNYNYDIVFGHNRTSKNFKFTKDFSRLKELQKIIFAPKNILTLFLFTSSNNQHTSFALFVPGMNDLYYFCNSNKLNANIKNLKNFIAISFYGAGRNFSFHQIRNIDIFSYNELKFNSLFRAKVLEYLLADLTYCEDLGFVLSSDNFILKNFSYSLKHFNSERYKQEIRNFFLDNSSSLNSLLAQTKRHSRFLSFKDFKPMETMPPDKLGKGKASKKVKAKNSSLNTLASSSKSSDSGATMTIDKESRSKNKKRSKGSKGAINLKGQREPAPLESMETLIQDLKKVVTLSEALKKCDPNSVLSWERLLEACQADRTIINCWIKTSLNGPNCFVKNFTLQRKFADMFRKIPMKLPLLMKPGVYQKLAQCRTILENRDSNTEKNDLLTALLWPLQVSELKQHAQIDTSQRQGSSDQVPAANVHTDGQQADHVPADDIDQPARAGDGMSTDELDCMDPTPSTSSAPASTILPPQIPDKRLVVPVTGTNALCYTFADKNDRLDRVPVAVVQPRMRSQSCNIAASLQIPQSRRNRSLSPYSTRSAFVQRPNLTLQSSVAGSSSSVASVSRAFLHLDDELLPSVVAYNRPDVSTAMDVDEIQIVDEVYTL